MAGITFSGFNDIDFSQVVSAIIASESQPLTTLQTKKTTLDTQNSAFGTLATKLSSLQSAFDALNNTTSLAGLKAVSSDSAIGVSAGTSNVEGSYDVVVSQLARLQVTASQSTYGSGDDIVATGGTLVLRDGQGNDTLITVTGPLKLTELAAAINNNTTAPVTASVVQTSPGTYQLVLTGKLTGSANSFQVKTSGLTGGATPLAFKDTDNDTWSGDSLGPGGDNIQDARNASLTVNSLAVQSASNIVNDVIPGVTLTLQKEDPAKTVNIAVTRDDSGARAKVDKLISVYNDFVTFLDAQRTQEIAGKAGISRDPLVRSLRDAMRSTFMQQYTGGGSFSRLAEVGIGFDRTGKLTLNQEIWNAAIEDTPEDVQALFSSAHATGGPSTGAFGALETLVKSYTDAGGLVADARERLTDAAVKVTDRIDAMSRQLDMRRQALQAQFTAADQTMTRLKNSASTLSTLSSVYRLF